jgi:hypothetical protein
MSVLACVLVGRHHVVFGWMPHRTVSGSFDVEAVSAVNNDTAAPPMSVKVAAR